MDATEFYQELNYTYNRAAKLYQQANTTTWEQRPEIVKETLKELRIALEELQIAEEELLQQNQQLQLANTAAEAERQRYYELFESAPDSYIVTDENGSIQAANLAATKLLNISRQFLIGKLLINFIPVEQRQTFRSRLAQLHQQDLTQEWEVSVCPRNTAIIDVAVTVSTVCDLQGKSTGWRWLLRDITARKQAEAKIRTIQLQNLQLQEAARLKSQFLAIMSHELRSPMNAIIGFSQLLLRQNQKLLAKSQQNMVERIFNSGKHLLTLIDDILDFSKIEAGSLQLNLKEINLAELVIDTLEELHSLFEPKNLELQIDINLENPNIINDNTRLRQVLVNLLSNAIKFTDTGSVQVKVWELDSDKVAIAIKDTGIGIAETDIQHIFDEFWQVNQTISRQHGGTGLGLAITNRLVCVMQGRITVNSQLGEGSAFCVELPRQVDNSTAKNVNKVDVTATVEQ